MVALAIIGAAAVAQSSFSSAWRFHRGDGSFASASFDDKAWRIVDLPHDYSSEDLPPRSVDNSTPVIEVRAGQWKFAEGIGSVAWAAPDFDDTSWRNVLVPSDWRDYGYTKNNATGWFRRRIEVSPFQVKENLRLALGDVSVADVTYINGIKVGQSGTIGDDSSCKDPLTYRSYSGNALNKAIKVGTNIIAVKVWSPGGAKASNTSVPGGLVDAEASDGRIGPFDPGASTGQRQTGYSVGGIGWYRRNFDTPRGALSEEPGASVSVFIEGCYMNCQLYLNGDKIGEEHPYGYTSFAVRVPTASLRWATISTGIAPSNVLAIRVNNNGSNSRWYSGAGLFRPADIFTHPPLHILPFWEGGVHVTTSQVSLLQGTRGRLAETTTVNVTVMIRNDGVTSNKPVDIMVTIAEQASGKVISKHSKLAPIVRASETATASILFEMKDAYTWSPEQPFLYTAAVTLGSQDAQNATFGVRSFSFDASHGMILNGQPIKLRGGCMHHDNGPLGSRAIARAEERRVELLKAHGYNAIRTSHNPVSRAFVSACERLGIILMEEAFDTWQDGKNPDDYHLYFDKWWRRDIASMVLRDRNSPAILLWSIGNEIGMRHTPAGVELSRQISALVRLLDPAPQSSRRAITSAVPGPRADNITDAFFAPLDVAGYNYAYVSDGRDHPRVRGRVIVATETFPLKSVENFRAARNKSAPFVIGTFIWTAMDYIGESAIGANGHYSPSKLACGDYCAMPWPYHISFCGDIDVVGESKPQSLLRRVMWEASTFEASVHRPGNEVIGAWGFRDERQSWTWPGMPRGTKLTVRAYAASGCVRLSVNGRAHIPRGRTALTAGLRGALMEGPASALALRSIDEEASSCVNVTSFNATFDVPYEAGAMIVTLHASPRDLAPLSSISFKTAGPPVSLRLMASSLTLRRTRDDLSYVRAELLDANGVRVECGTYSDDLRYNMTSNEPYAPPVWCAPLKVSFEVVGDAELAAVGSGDPLDVSSFQATTRETYRGTATAIIRPGKTGAQPSAGRVTLTASAEGMSADAILILIE